MMTPFSVPSAAPMNGAMPMANQVLKWTAVHAERTLTTPTMAAVERSKPPPMMTRVPAQAMIARGAFWLRMLKRFVGVRNASEDSDRAMNKARKSPTTAYLRARLPVLAGIPSLARAYLLESGAAPPGGFDADSFI